jgi:hypothetical protein
MSDLGPRDEPRRFKLRIQAIPQGKWRWDLSGLDREETHCAQVNDIPTSGVEDVKASAERKGRGAATSIRAAVAHQAHGVTVEEV